jgi:hypothetical protein
MANSAETNLRAVLCPLFIFFVNVNASSVMGFVGWSELAFIFVVVIH